MGVISRTTYFFWIAAQSMRYLWLDNTACDGFFCLACRWVAVPGRGPVGFSERHGRTSD